jgi:hypothetical protein
LVVLGIAGVVVAALFGLDQDGLNQAVDWIKRYSPNFGLKSRKSRLLCHVRPAMNARILPQGSCSMVGEFVAAR